MDDPTLNRLLRLVDDPAEDPTEFKDALRAELRDTLERGSTVRLGPAPSVERAITSGLPIERPRWRIQALAVAVSIAALVVGLVALVNIGSGGTAPSAPVSAPPTTLTTLPAVPTTLLPTVESACATYTDGAPTFAELEGVAELADTSPTSNPVAAVSLPDLRAAAASLEELGATLVAGDLISEEGAVSLQIAAGGIAQARAELEAGDTSAAARSVGFALRELSDLNDPPDAIDLPGCGFP